MRTRHCVYAVTLCGALVAMLAFATVGSVDANQYHDPPGPSDHALIAEGFLRLLGTTEAIPGVQGADELTLGSFAQVHTFSRAFSMKEKAENLEDEVLPEDEWLAPVLFNGQVVGGVVVMWGPPGWSVGEILSQSEGEKLAAMQSGDRVSFDAPLGAVWIVRGQDVLPFDGSAEALFPNGTSLAEYQTFHDSTMATAAGEMTPGTPAFGSAGGGPPPTRSATGVLSTASLSVLVLLTVGVGALVLMGMRYRLRHR